MNKSFPTDTMKTASQKEKTIAKNQSSSDNIERSKIIPVAIEEQSIGK